MSIMIHSENYPKTTKHSRRNSPMLSPFISEVVDMNYSLALDDPSTL